MAKSSQMTTYVARRGQFIKIGRTTNICRRMSALRSAAPLLEGAGGPVHLLFTHPSDVEAYLHRRWGRYRADSEWYRFEGDLAEWIDAVLTGARKVVPDGRCEGCGDPVDPGPPGCVECPAIAFATVAGRSTTSGSSGVSGCD